MNRPINTSTEYFVRRKTTNLTGFKRKIKNSVASVYPHYIIKKENFFGNYSYQIRVSFLLITTCVSSFNHRQRDLNNFLNPKEIHNYQINHHSHSPTNDKLDQIATRQESLHQNHDQCHDCAGEQGFT